MAQHTSADSPIVRLVRLPPVVPAGVLADCERVLDEAERTRAAAYQAAGAREAFVIARAVLRHSLSAVAPVASGDWAFEHGAYGKPFVAGPAGGRAVHFNLSHTPGLVACAVSANGPVGIDAESLHPADSAAAPLLLMSQAERAELADLSDDERRRRCREIWAAKEAYGKALGKGVHNGLRDVTVRDAATRPVLTGVDPELARWRLQKLDAGDGHVVVLAAADDRPARVRWHRLGDPFPTASAANNAESGRPAAD